MKAGVLVVLLSASISWTAEAGQPTRQRGAPAAPDKIAQAYEQYLQARYLEGQDNIDGAVAAYKRAMELDPTAADIPASLAALYLQQNKFEDAMATSQQALKVAPANPEANRVVGLLFAALAENERGPQGRRGNAAQPSANIAQAIEHLERALVRPVGDPDPNLRATLARLYLRAQSYDKAISLLHDLVRKEPQWQAGPDLLAEAYAGAGRNDDAIEWLSEAARETPTLYATLGDFYEREGRWKESADAYGNALQTAPSNAELKTRYASALLNIGGRADVAKARDVLTELVSGRTPSPRAMYLLSQAQRRLGDLDSAEKTARRVIEASAQSPWGYYALAEALEERRAYQQIVDALAPAVERFRARASGDPFNLGLLLPHLGFAYQELRQLDQALAAFDEAHRLAPNDLAITSYLIQANLAAKRFGPALDLIRAARRDRPTDLRFARLEAQALHQSGKQTEAIGVLEEAVKQHADQPSAYVALAQLYSESEKGAQAVKLLQDAQSKFPTDLSISFELGAVFDKQKRYADAEAVFRQVLARDPENAPALNYLGYMLAERGERLAESVAFLQKALQIEPENGSYLDSLGWAYFKENKLDLAADNLKRAAEQLTANSVIQDHYGEVLYKLGRYDEAIAAWTRALAGDGDSINRAEIDKKIRTAKQKLGKR